MGKINWSKAVLGGVVAGVIVNLMEMTLHGFILAADWKPAMESLGRNMEEKGSGGMVLLFGWGFLVGLTALWIYAAIRPRYGAGPKTAITAGFMVWLLAYLSPTLVTVAFDLYPPKLDYVPLLEGLVEAPLATLAGAWLYKEA